MDTVSGRTEHTGAPSAADTPGTTDAPVTAATEAHGTPGVSDAFGLLGAGGVAGAVGEFVGVAERAGFVVVVEGAGRVEVRGVRPDGSVEGAMRFHLCCQAGEWVWRYEFPARPVGGRGSGMFNNFPRHPDPGDFARLGWWWRHFSTGPGWRYRPQGWMRPRSWTRSARSAA
ncbi:hypothetical protein SAMN05421803_11919 [Nocardiopsis flavescens]|uniref:Uncharacterized protein n=1 Tax=Nocardiopsis flavescens TaxID=758803 RepID=A0A1M6S3S5_9ACTN|nr:hypothetical protein [Nocardiopsis flavescens]SHK39484.1 hypothetical protein SAMN05421803_11919 [Nocardiopsis flavescens]